VTVTVDTVAGELNIVLKQGETWQLELVICDSDEVALDLSSGYTAAMQVRTFAGASGSALVSLTNGSGITLAAGTNDADPDNCVPNVVCALDDEATAALAAGAFSYDLFVEETGSDDNMCWVEGKFIVKAAITHG
jgi:hypothetical protein